MMVSSATLKRTDRIGLSIIALFPRIINKCAIDSLPALSHGALFASSGEDNTSCYGPNNLYEERSI